MKSPLPYLLLALALLATWLLLNQTLAAGEIILGIFVALAALAAYRALRIPPRDLRARPLVAVRLAFIVLVDIVRANMVVAAVVLRPRHAGRAPGFVDIPLELRNPAGLAVLSCIIAATPDTFWARYDSVRGVLTLHIIDGAAKLETVRTVKNRYERPLLEMFK